MTIPADLSRLSPGDHVQEPFLVLKVETRTGDHPHTVLILGNCTGRISTSPFWPEQEPKIAGIRRRAIVQVAGEIATYRETLQLKVTSIQVLSDGEVEATTLMPSVGPVGRFWAHLDRFREDIEGTRLRAVVDLFFAQPDFRKRFEECPASLAGHHAEVGGLLMHTSEVLAIALAIARVAAADKDLVVAGVLLHDIGKVLGYRWDGAFDLTELNALHGHVVLGALMLDRAVRACPEPPCTDQELAILTHLVLSHHGTLAFGAPVPPCTLEAEVIHYADNASAKTASMGKAIHGAGNFALDALVSTSGLWEVDRRRVYRGISDWGAP